MRRFLPLISLLFCTALARAAAPERFFPTDEGERAEYAVVLEFGEARLSGICVVKRMEGRLAGSMLNEFGIRAFDFRCGAGDRRAELSNVTAFLDRWYIRRTLRRDLALLLNHEGGSQAETRRGRSIATLEDGSLYMRHLHRKMSYRFVPLNP